MPFEEGKQKQDRCSLPEGRDKAPGHGHFTELEVPGETGALDDVEKLSQQFWLLSREVILIGQQSEEVTGQLHGRKVSAQEFGAEKCQSFDLIVRQGLPYL